MQQTTGDNYEAKFGMRPHAAAASVGVLFLQCARETQVMTSWVGLLPGENIQKNQPHSEKMTPLRDCHSARWKLDEFFATFQKVLL